MTDGLLFRVGDLVGLDEPCGVLSPAELDGLMEGRLGPDRLAELESHAAACPACAELLDDLAQYRSLLLSGLTIPAERNAFESSNAAVRRRLGLGRACRRFRDWLSRMSPLWLTPALATVLLLAVWLWPSRPLLIAAVDAVPLQPPPTVRGVGLSETWDRLQGPWEKDDMRQAARVLERAVKRFPGEADLWFYLGVARLRSGDAGEAVDALLEADRIEAAVPSENTRWMLAAALERVGRVEEACTALRSVAGIGGAKARAAREIAERSCR